MMMRETPGPPPLFNAGPACNRLQLSTKVTGTIGIFFSIASLNAPFLKGFISGAFNGIVPSGKITTLWPLSTSPFARSSAEWASTMLLRFTDMFIPLLKKIWNNGHELISIFPIKMK